MAAVEALKSCMAAGTPLVMKSYSLRPNPRVDHPFTGSTTFPRSLLNYKQKKPPVLCCTGRAGSTDRKDGWSYWKFKGDIKRWCDKQSLPVGAAVYIAMESFQSAVWGLVWKRFVDCFIDVPMSIIEQGKPFQGIYYPLLVSITSPLHVARTYAVLKASVYGTRYVMGRLTGKKPDVLTSMVAGFIFGIMFTLVAGMRDPVMLSIGVLSALVFGLLHKLMLPIMKMFKLELREC